MERDKVIVRTGFIGIATNILLVTAKIIIGTLSNSIAIIMDAVNNLSDVMSSLITIIGVKLAARPADKEHPMGHGRIEYLSTMLIAALIIAAGIGAFVEAFKKILAPEETLFTASSLTIILLAIFVKLALGHYTKKKGQQVDSDALIASGTDALFDAIITAATLLGGLVSLVWGIIIDGYLALLISFVVIKAGVDIMRDVVNDILGSRISPEQSKQIKKDICEVKGVIGAYDLILNNYGPNKYSGSVHVEVSDKLTAPEIDNICRNISAHVYKKHKIIITASIYAVPSLDGEIGALYSRIKNTVLSIPGALQVHGFHLDKEKNIIRFDVVKDFKVKDKNVWLKEVLQKLQQAEPTYKFLINVDIDYSD